MEKTACVGQDENRARDAEKVYRFGRGDYSK